MLNTKPLFADRRDAGRKLAMALLARQPAQAVVLALPRGGVPVAYEVARTLNAPLGVVLVRKLGAPYHPEFAIGAVAEVRARHRVLDPQIDDGRGFGRIDPAWIEQQAQLLFEEIARRRARYAGPSGALAPPLAGRTAIVVDDGLATGYTMRAALAAVAAERPAHLLFAVPVGSADMVRALQAQAEGICLHSPEHFGAVSLYYTDFNQTGDEEVIALLARARDEYAAFSKESKMQTISEVMTRDVAVIGPNESLERAAQLMSEWDVGSIPVCDGQRLLGMITDRDITVRATADGRPPKDVHVGEIMSEGVSYCHDDQQVDEVLQQMRDEQIRRLPVVDRNMQLCGIVSIGDIATDDDASVDDAMEGISTPSEPNRPSGDQMRR